MTLITLLLPTRGRPFELVDSVETVLSKATDPERVQFYFACDNDDHDTIETVLSLRRPVDEVLILYPMGYAGLHEYCNRMLNQSKGQWFMMWNDDAYMMTDEWDEVIASSNPRDILNPLTTLGVEDALFPVVPKEFVQAVGHWSLSPHTDTWWQDIGLRCGNLRRVPILIDHTPTGPHGGPTTEEFYSRRMTSLRIGDAEVVQSLLEAG